MVKLYTEGIKKMNEEFDMMNILKALRKEEDQVIDLDSEADGTGRHCTCRWLITQSDKYNST